uniref:Uncharacterized protein n=1 Tax=viral metagenome TaxID=1070528 RepID=A0A6M3LTH7_9ZZZZ
MAKKIREIEVEYPDCTICGNEISGGEEYFDININLGKITVGESGGGTGIRSGNNQRPLKLCKKCSKYIKAGAVIEEFGNTGTFIIHKIMVEVEMQKQELEKMDKRN